VFRTSTRTALISGGVQLTLGVIGGILHLVQAMAGHPWDWTHLAIALGFATSGAETITSRRNQR
jgi:hypothetical protein